MSEEKKEVKAGHSVRRLEIEPAETGGFITTVIHKDKPGAKGAGGAGPMYQEPDKHVHGNIDQVHAFMKECFPSPTSRTKKGKSSTSEKGGSRVDTYEGGQGDDVS
jgi:hypothetical protein